AALLAAGIAWVPALRRAPARGTAAQAAREQQVTIARAIAEAVANTDAAQLDEGSRDDMQALEALAKQLGGTAQSSHDLEQARGESAAKMDAVAQRLADAAQRNLDALDEVTRRVTSFEPPQSARGQGPPPELNDLLDKLRHGELEQAAQQAQETSQKRDEL